MPGIAERGPRSVVSGTSRATSTIRVGEGGVIASEPRATRLAEQFERSRPLYPGV